MANERPLMKCGHTAMATKNGKPCCPICIGIDSRAEEIADMPSLDGRKAYCKYCGREKDSDYQLPFFALGRWKRGIKDTESDSYYCGCRGWD